MSLYYCSRRFIDRRDFQYIEMDTDSAYMALTNSLEDLVKPEKRRDFYESYGDWFPRPYCDKHEEDFIATKLAKYESGGEDWKPSECCSAMKLYDRRTPGLFKEEFEGLGMIALNSKTYCCWKDDDNDTPDKLSSKGLSKITNSLRVSDYKKVLFDKTSVSGTNKGFVVKNNSMYTYSARRRALSYFYTKRRLHDDGVTTSCLNI